MVLSSIVMALTTLIYAARTDRCLGQSTVGQLNACALEIVLKDVLLSFMLHQAGQSMAMPNTGSRRAQTEADKQLLLGPSA